MGKFGNCIRSRFGRVPPLLLAAAVFLSGCAHNLDLEKSGFVRVFTPQVPVLLSGPAAVLLTNTGGFSARVALQERSGLPGQVPAEGELLGLGSKLVFAPRESGRPDKNPEAGGFSYIWDVALGSGFILSEALQGYAPVSSTLRATNKVVSGASPLNVTVFLNDGAKEVFRVWPNGERREFPSRIESSSAPVFTATVSKVRFQAPAADLFAPPPGFTKYPTPEALADEIAARRQNFRRGTRGSDIYSVPGIERK